MFVICINKLALKIMKINKMTLLPTQYIRRNYIFFMHQRGLSVSFILYLLQRLSWPLVIEQIVFRQTKRLKLGRSILRKHKNRCLKRTSTSKKNKNIDFIIILLGNKFHSSMHIIAYSNNRIHFGISWRAKWLLAF